MHNAVLTGAKALWHATSVLAAADINPLDMRVASIGSVEVTVTPARAAAAAFELGLSKRVEIGMPHGTVFERYFGRFDDVNVAVVAEVAGAVAS